MIILRNFNMDKNLLGVSCAYKKDGSIYYRSSITYRQKHISLGSYPAADTAHAAYLEGSTLLFGIQPALTDYSSKSSLPFEKWVCLTNFRDNNIYFSTPIYIRKKYFDYFLSPEEILKFDMDDLFYYSSHKIMRRGRHFFVADYGMQVNIMSRYGIKNYAVKDRDYRFVNGDDMDFRYENIEIINIYHGVTRKDTQKGVRYVAKIHINGNYTIGAYTTDIEAAIAYNKAIDILQKAGINRQFSPNYLENLSPSAYADIYTKLHISKKITDYLRV